MASQWDVKEDIGKKGHPLGGPLSSDETLLSQSGAFVLPMHFNFAFEDVAYNIFPSKDSYSFS